MTFLPVKLKQKDILLATMDRLWPTIPKPSLDGPSSERLITSDSLIDEVDITQILLPFRVYGLIPKKF